MKKFDSRESSTQRMDSKQGLGQYFYGVGEISQQEEKDIDFILRELDVEQNNAENLVPILETQLRMLEQANIVQLIHSRGASKKLIKQCDEAESSLSNMKKWFDEYNVEVSKMNKQVMKIQKSSHKMAIQDKNNKRLYSTLENILRSVTVDDETENYLERPRLTNLTRLPYVINAAEDLKRVLTNDLPQEVLQMEGIQTQLNGYYELKHSFAIKLFDFLESELSKLSSTIEQTLKKKPTKPTLSSYQKIHKFFLKFYKLNLWLADLDDNNYKKFQAKYIRTLRHLYKKQFNYYFDFQSGKILKESNKGNNILQLSTGVSTQKNHDGSKKKLWYLFKMILDDLIPVFLDEQKFCNKFFQISKEKKKREEEKKLKEEKEKEKEKQIKMEIEIEKEKEKEKENENENENEKENQKVKNKENEIEKKEEKENEIKSKNLENNKNEKNTFSNSDYTVEEIFNKFVTKLFQTKILRSSKINQFSLIQMLASVDKRHKRYTNKSTALTTLFSKLSQQLHHIFSEFIDQQTFSITEAKLPSKGREIALVFQKFPIFYDLMETYVRNSQRDLADTVYRKIVVEMFKWLKTCAKEKQKKGEIILLENFKYFSETVKERPQLAKFLDSYVEEAESTYEKCMSDYIEKKIIYKEFSDLIEFFGKIDVQLDSNTPEEVVFQKEFSKQALSVRLKKFINKPFPDRRSSMYKRITKHLPSDYKLIQIAKKRVETKIIQLWKHWNEICLKCYAKKISPTVQEVEEHFLQIKEN
ncbi:exocyst complex component 1-related [Anaeramoeba flamelloides]|uniref:Exocyst complex component 1-related n=1 Tax=Anaeramoeba flamelloides TaxID=1746091 RepID=A0AAV7Y0S4_9EUKA|nr:exocyst complex component 1-related [Anaeramoeba flamelloides]